MKDRTNRRLLIIFGLCLLLSLGAIAIGFLGIVDALDSGIVGSIRNWIAPLVSIRRDSPEIDPSSIPDNGPTAFDLEATRLAGEQTAIAELHADWPVVYEDAFDLNQADWPEFEEEDNLANLKVEVVNGKYRWEALAKTGFVWWAYPDMDDQSDLFAEVEALQLEGDPYGEMGLVFRLDEDRFYLYQVSGEFYSLWRSVSDGWDTLIDWTESAKIQNGAVNLLGVLVIEDRIHLLINDQLVAEVTDAHYDAGVVGLAVGLDDAGDEGTFEFDNLVVTAP